MTGPTSAATTTITTNPIILRWATRTDIPSITQILFLNVLNFELKDHWAPTRHENKQNFYDSLLARIRLNFATPGFRYMVAERVELDITGQRATVIGFAGWNAQGGAANVIREEWLRQVGWAEWMEWKLAEIEMEWFRKVRSQVTDYRMLARTVEGLHNGWLGVVGDVQLYLQCLMVDPKVHRGGVGAKLLQWGMDVADTTSVPVTLTASRIGHPFYLKHGFKVMKTVRIDTNPEKAFDMPLMLYEPKGVEGSSPDKRTT